MGSSSTAPATRVTATGPIVLERPEDRDVIVKAFVFVPVVALAAAVPLAWGWGSSWVDVGERPGWASGVRWPTPRRLARLTAARGAS